MINIEDTEASQSDDLQNPIKDWKSKFEAGTLETAQIIKFFQVGAPNFFELSADTIPVRCTFNEAGAKENIIDVLEEFLCDDNPQTMLEKLKSEGNVSSVCGRVFKSGEPTYSCRECGMDPTCVLCVNCFKQSAHRNHKYKMSTSNGGGCCDCGDTEAWKRDQYCEEHSRGNELSIESSVITNRMKERCEIAFRAALMYCVKILEIESHACLECLDGDGEDVYCTVLYNDESHTFEQVIQTLTKIVKCSQKDAMELVTSIDREGRAVVKCDVFDACASLKEAIEKQPMRHSSNVKLSPLKVSVLHKKAVSCQQFALQLLTWFQEFLTRHRIFRSIFASVAGDKRCPSYNIGHILEYDWKLWKTSRSCWHRLLISGLLMEYEHKKMLAIEFTKHYATIIQDFIRDDHDYSISVVSLSVQLFTVPTIAHYLIANESVFHKLMHTFYWETIEKYVQNKILHFAKNTANLNVFKRSAYILYDLRYILSFKPDVWTPELREGFIEGVKVLLKLLNVMQGMDAVYRQTGQHMDYEPEWESAFNLHIKLANVISSVLEWCSTDRAVLLKVYQMVIKHINDNEFILDKTSLKEQTLAGHCARCLIYDVSANNVSIHLPLSRFFAGLYLHLEKFGLNFDNATTINRRTPEEIIEPVLCTQTMIAQAHAGMWRRNGYSLLHQLYFYKNVRCRSEMLDRDIVALQIGAALIESNQYMIHILNKFNLLNWASPAYDTSSATSSDDEYLRQLNMIDEVLELLIMIVGERYMPGIGVVTEEDRIKKEIIQQLCIKSFSHSELNRSLPDTNNKTVFEDVIDAIATFKKPAQSDTKGVYELKEGLYDDYNLYFYHYTKEEKSKSEESQRLRRKNKGQLVCCPPPKLPKLSDSFVSIANLLQCDVMLHVVRTVLSRALDLKARSFSESHLQKILHLIGYGLQEEQSNNYPFLTFCDRAIKYDILQLLDMLTNNARVETHRDYIIWVTKKFKELQKRAHESEMENEEVNEPMTATEVEEREKAERRKLAADRRAVILAQMASAQDSFMKFNPELFASTSTTVVNAESMDYQETDESHHLPVGCFGPRKKFQVPEDQKFKCILCFEDCSVTKDDICLMYSAFIQKSNVLIEPSEHSVPAPYTSSCGHVMHPVCWQVYFDNEVLKESRRPNRNRSPSSFTVDKKEFLCPYCRCLCNAILPLTPALCGFETPRSETEPRNVLSFEKWLDILGDYSQELHAAENAEFSKHNVDGTSQFIDIEELVKKHTELEEFERICSLVAKNEINAEWKRSVDAFMKNVKRAAPYPYTSEDCESHLVTWNSCAYTIQTMEMYLRAIQKPFKNEMSIRHTSCLNGLIRVCCLLGSCLFDPEARKLMIHLRGYLETIFHKKGGPCVEWDIFHMMASLIFLSTALMYRSKNAIIVPCGNFFEFYMLKTMFLANIAKAIILFRPGDTLLPMDVDDAASVESKGSEFGATLREYFKTHNLYLKDSEHQATSEISIGQLVQHVKNESKVFLRCSCLFFHFMTDAEFPEEFDSPYGDTFEIMCAYLGLSADVKSYFCPTSTEFKILSNFATHPDLVQHSEGAQLKLNIVPSVLPVRQLISLPDDYSDLINSVSDFRCPNNEREESRNPTMCLICGTKLCAQSYCCQPELEKSAVGACTYHAQFCGAGVGIFLRIRDCEIVFLGLNKGCFFPPPYLDEYGESDQGLRRGNPLRLCKERYRKLNLMWLGHSLHEEIARLNETTNSVITQWQHI